MNTVQLNDGLAVKFVDAKGVTHDALITTCWGNRELNLTDKDAGTAINLVYVTTDETRRDQYGQQTVHHTSVVHRSRQAAPGMYWYHPAEVA